MPEEKEWYRLEELDAERPVDPVAVGRHKARMLAEVRAYELAEIRKAQRLSQQEVAEAMQVSQSRVSRIEHGELARSEMSTLQAYVEALGGTLEIGAVFGDRYVVLEGGGQVPG